MRRLIIEEPVSRPARWSPRVAFFALAAAGIAVLVTRGQTGAVGPALVAVLAALALSLLAIGLALAAFVRIWREGRRGFGLAVGGLLLALATLAYPAYFGLRGLLLPAITDVTTDIENPPTFSRSRLALAARDGRLPPDPSPAAREAQREAYPQIAPLTLDLTPEEAFEIARKAAANRRWEIVETLKPGGRVGIGRIEAVAYTPLLHLPEDVTVRIRPRADGARIDVRAASRLTGHDFGEGADRIRAYLEEASNLAVNVK